MSQSNRQSLQGPDATLRSDPSDPPFRCDHPGCSAWATFGEGWSGRRSIRGRWWCGPHYRELQVQRAEAAQKSSSSVDRVPKQLMLGQL
ncbi:hypothetical protein FHS85_001767 [Rhodoligotrophos appendicifer]